jgi:integrase
MGHSTLAMTFDRYGHLFPGGDDAAEMAAGEALLTTGCNTNATKLPPR